MRRVETGHPKLWVVVMNVKRQLVKLHCRSRSLIWSVLLYIGDQSTEAQRKLGQFGTRGPELIGSGQGKSRRGIGSEDLVTSNTVS